MIIVVINGGVGSQLFQYCAAYNLAKKINSKIYLDICFYNGLKHNPTNPKLAANIFNFFEVIKVNKIRIIKNIWISRFLRIYFSIVSFLTFGFIKYQRIDIDEPFEFKEFPIAKHYFINGNPNNLSYIEDHLEKFLTKFILNKKKKFKKIRVGIHVRRDDYADTVVDVCGKDYYKNAIDKFFELTKLNSSDVKFIIFCQEFEWPKKNIDFGETETQYLIGSHHDAPNDFREMCDCDHLIIPNSSFSWWPAQIISKQKDGLIFCPDLWWDKIDINKINIYPSNWIVIKTKNAQKKN